MISSTIICGDCRHELKKIPNCTVQSIVTSPPYWGLRDYGHPDQIGLEDTIDEYLSQLNLIFNELLRILKNDGILWLNIGDGFTSGNRKYRAKDSKYSARYMSKRPMTPKSLKEKELIGIPWRVAFMLQEIGWYLRNDIIWHKPNAMPESVQDRPNRSHEYLFMLTKNSHYSFQKEYLKNDNDEILRSVWTIKNNSRSTVHSATIPNELVKYCIKTSSRKGDLILDPFCGIGTVGHVSINEERQFLGIEINSEFADNARTSLEN